MVNIRGEAFWVCFSTFIHWILYSIPLFDEVVIISVRQAHAVLKHASGTNHTADIEMLTRSGISRGKNRQILESDAPSRLGDAANGRVRLMTCLLRKL